VYDFEHEPVNRAGPGETIQSGFGSSGQRDDDREADQNDAEEHQEWGRPSSARVVPNGDTDASDDDARAGEDDLRNEAHESLGLAVSTPSAFGCVSTRRSNAGSVDDPPASDDSACMPRPTRVQAAQIAVLSVFIFVGIKVVVALLVFGISVATGGWTDRP